MRRLLATAVSAVRVIVGRRTADTAVARIRGAVYCPNMFESTNNNKALLLFDIDGTLLLTGGAGMRAMAAAGRRLFGDAFKWDGIAPGGSLDPLILADALKLNGVEDDDDLHTTFRDHYVELLQHELTVSRDRVRIMPGILDLLAALRRRVETHDDVVIGMLTGNYAAAVPHKLDAVGIDLEWFTITAFGDEGATRPDLVALAMRKYEQAHGQTPHPRRVIVIGDTHKDVHCAKAHGCFAFAVTTSGRSREELEQAGADIVVDDLSDPTPLWQLIDTGVADRV